MINMFPTSAIDPFPKSGFTGGDPYEQYNDLFASLFTFPAPAPVPLTEPIIQTVADGNAGEGLYALPGESPSGVAKPFSDGMADILGIFPAGHDLNKKPVQIGTEELPLSDVEPKKEDARFLGPPIPAIPAKSADTAPIDGHNEDPEDVCSMPVDGKVPTPKLDAKNFIQPIDGKVDRRKHEDDNSIEFEVLELPADPATPVHKIEPEAPREVKPAIVTREHVQNGDLMAAAAAGALNSDKLHPVESTAKIWAADLKEHKVAKKIENATLLETFTNNVVADNSVALGAKSKATVRDLWEGAETFVELKDQAEERPQAELATEFSFDSALNGGSALGKTEKPVGAEVKARRMILDQVGSSLTDLALQHKEGAGERVLKIKLKPAELGTVEITLSKKADGVIDAHFKTDNPHTQHMLSETLAQLRDSLENSGMKVGNLETSCSNSFSGGNASGERDRQTFSTPREQLFDQPQFSASTKTNDESKLDRLLNLRA